MNKNTLSLFIILILLFSCNSSKQFDIKEDEFVSSYKKAVLFGCIDSATNNKFREFSKNNNDLGLAGEVAVIFHSSVEEAQKFGEELSKNIRNIEYSDYEGRQPIFSDCISFAFSEKTDSIAKTKYKELQNSTLEYIYD